MFYEAPLPEQLIEPAAAKHPQVTSVFTDFVPTLHKRFPSATDVITVTMMGTDLDGLDPTSVATALQVNIAGAAVTNPIKVISGPTALGSGTSGATAIPSGSAIAVQLTVAPSYKLPLALQMKGTDGAVINTPPFAVPRLDADDMSKYAMIRRITGPVDEPAQQQQDELIISTPGTVVPITSEVLKAEIEKLKAENHRKIDVNIVNHGADH